MASIIVPRLIALDTSTIADFARDLNSPRGDRRRAERFLAEFAARAWVPVISLENIVETLRYAEVATVRDRLGALAGFAQAAHVNSVRSPGSIGSIVDTLAREVRAFLRNTGGDALAVARAVRGELFAYTDGITAASRLRQVVEKARPFAQHTQPAGEVVSSAQHLNIMGTDGVTLGSLCDEGPLDRASIDRYCAKLRSHLQATLRSRGVKGTDEGALDAFAERCAKDCRGKLLEAFGPDNSCTAADMMARLLQSGGIDASQLSAGTTVGELRILWIYNRRLAEASCVLGLPQPVTMREVPIDKCPSQIVQNGVESRRKSAPRAQAGDLFDAHLSTLACYCDLTVVDKRTKEYLRQLREHDTTAARLMGKVVSLSSSRYTDLLREAL
jgi:hypothetical protein